MSKASFNKIAAQIEKDGFERGYRQAVKDMRRLLGGALDSMLKAHEEPEAGTEEVSLTLTEIGEIIKATQPEAIERRVAETIVPRSKLSAEDRVFEMIKSIPGLRGTAIVEALEQTGEPVKERTVRTSLWRLKTRKLIELRGKEWYVTPYGKDWYVTHSPEEILPPQ